MSRWVPDGSTVFADEPTKGSRFLALVSHTDTTHAALQAVADAQARWPDASHHCFAYRLAQGTHRTSDDGEPSGSAGPPILAMIDGHDMVDTTVVVARWFGGTKLGVGGLIRAYGGCAGRALDAAPRTFYVPEVEIRLSFSYPDTSAVEQALTLHDARIIESNYADRVTLTLRLATTALHGLQESLRDGTAGRVQAIASP